MLSRFTPVMAGKLALLLGILLTWPCEAQPGPPTGERELSGGCLDAHFRAERPQSASGVTPGGSQIR